MSADIYCEMPFHHIKPLILDSRVVLFYEKSNNILIDLTRYFSLFTQAQFIFNHLSTPTELTIHWKILNVVSKIWREKITIGFPFAGGWHNIFCLNFWSLRHFRAQFAQFSVAFYSIKKIGAKITTRKNQFCFSMFLRCTKYWILKWVNNLL